MKRDNQMFVLGSVVTFVPGMVVCFMPTVPLLYVALLSSWIGSGVYAKAWAMRVEQVREGSARVSR